MTEVEELEMKLLRRVARAGYDLAQEAAKLTECKPVDIGAHIASLDELRRIFVDADQDVDAFDPECPVALNIARRVIAEYERGFEWEGSFRQVAS